MKNTHGGKREGAGNKPKPDNKYYIRRIHKDLFAPMDEYLKELKLTIKQK